ncbi:MarR family winged helix-turn-helix transcriptional regulator [Streptomyces sp. AK04-3B]|uniref:MarR family winged helix-turn-helix transcriptional regulator n=1 Tax=unclassified Streptomyces TaxID=2593676 RepID=UPI0029BB4517|nr:MarR family transcriptional regulator [Streptomyces sp. AK04-3B]MDX3803074.1 MarR family transcriptional regulator [Streptomyces sp. AK04-3B]
MSSRRPTPADPSRKDPSRRDPVDAIAEQWATVRPDLDTAAMEVFGRIGRIARAMGDRMEQAYAALGIARGEFDVLATLRRSGEPYTLSPRQLSATLMLTTGGMTGRLDKLERAGLLRRSPDPHDRRGLQVTLTERGLELADRAVGAGLAVQTDALAAALNAEQADRLADLLRELLLSTETPRS